MSFSQLHEQDLFLWDNRAYIKMASIYDKDGKLVKGRAREIAHFSDDKWLPTMNAEVENFALYADIQKVEMLFN